jgi:tripartite motif-containing protein 71
MTIVMMLATGIAGIADTAATAGPKSFRGSVDANGPTREHEFEVTRPGQIVSTLRAGRAGASLSMFLYDPAGRLAASATSATGGFEQITHQAEATGTWRVVVRARSGASPYSLEVIQQSAARIAPRYVDTVGGGTKGHAAMYPSGLDVDGAGNVYVADTGDDQIQKYNSSGRRVWVVGKRGSRAAGFENPRDVAVHSGKVYVADTGFNRVRVLRASDGSFLSEWPRRFGTIMGISVGVNGQGNRIVLVSESSANLIQIFSLTGTFIRSVGGGRLNGVRDAATDANGNIFAADFANSRVVKFGPGGGFLDAWGVNGTGPRNLKRPYGIEVGRSGKVYVADSNNYIHKFTSSGRFLKAYGAPGTGRGRFQMLRRVALGPGTSPAVYGADLWTYKIEIFRQKGRYLRTLGGRGPAAGFFNEPFGFAVDRTHLFVVDMVNQRVQRFASTSPFRFQLKWGARGWGEGNTGLNWARDATIGSNGGSKTVWVADTKNNRVIEYRPDGTATGRKFGGAGSLNWPHAVDAVGADLIVANTVNNRIERWDPSRSSVEWPQGGFNNPKDVAVSGGEVFVADSLNKRIVVLSAAGGGVVDQFGGAALHRPEGVAVEPNGDVWVADTSWNRLVEFSPSGAVIQTFGTLGRTNTKFNKPVHLEVLTRPSNVFLLVMDSWNDRLQIYDIG